MTAIGKFILKHAKQLFIFIILAIFFIGLLNYFAFNHWGIGCRPDPGPVPDVVVDTWSKPLTEAGFKPAEIVKPVHVPDDKVPAGEPVLYGHGTVDSTEVEVIGVQTPDGGKWVRVIVGGKPVHFDSLQWLEQPTPEQDNDWSVIAECAIIGDGPDFGAGVAWEPVSVLGADMGLAVTADINRDILTAPDWIAVSGRLSRSWGPVTFGADAGWRMGEDSGLHLGGAVGLTIGL